MDPERILAQIRGFPNLEFSGMKKNFFGLSGSSLELRKGSTGKQGSINPESGLI